MRVCQLCLLAGAVLGASHALAADGLPSQSALDAMGLSGMQVISDSEALNVRGLGFKGASAFGQSWAVVASHGANAGSVNGYNAKGSHVAKGQNNSYAKIIVEKSKGNHGGGHGGGYSAKGGHGGGYGGVKETWSIGAFSGGSSYGSIKH